MKINSIEFNRKLTSAKSLEKCQTSKHGLSQGLGEGP